MKKLSLLILTIITFSVNAQEIYLQSQNAIVYNSIGSLVTKDTSILIGKISCASWSDDFTSLQVTYRYINAVTGQVVKIDNYSIQKTDIDNLYNAIKGGLPSLNSYCQLQQYIYYYGFRILMAETFNMSPNQINIID